MNVTVVEDYAKELTRKTFEHVENLTRQQLETTLVQALKSGDFERCVDVNRGMQGISYVPYRGINDCKAKICELQETLQELVDLKELKDLDGKTEDYLLRKPEAWKRAKLILKA